MNKFLLVSLSVLTSVSTGIAMPSRAVAFDELYDPSTGLTESQIRAVSEVIGTVEAVDETPSSTAIEIPVSIVSDAAALDAAANDIVEYRAAKVALLQTEIAWYGFLKANLVNGRALVREFEVGWGTAGKGTGALVVDYAVLKLWLSRVRPTVALAKSAMAQVEKDLGLFRSSLQKTGKAFEALTAKGQRMPTFKAVVGTVAFAGVVVGQVYAIGQGLYAVTMSQEKFDQIIANLDANIASLKQQQEKLSDAKIKKFVKAKK